jgi:hypothetical protein
MRITVPVLVALTLVGARAAAQSGSPATCSSAVAADTVPCPEWTGAGYLIVPTAQERGSARNLTDLLAGHAAGLYVRRSSGEAGAAARLYLRGPSHLTLPDRPLVVVDGLRAAASAVAPGLFTGVTATSPLDDLDPEEVDSIRVLPGAAAAARYGPAAAAGALLITTRRGAGPGFRVAGFARVGASDDAGSYPANYMRPGTFSGGGRGPCTLVLQAHGACLPADSLYAFNPLEQASPFRRGTLWTAGARVDGGVGPVSYLASVSRGSQQGVLRDAATRTDLHGRVALRLPRHFEAGASAAWVERDLDELQVVNTLSSAIPAALLGNAEDDSLRGYAAPVSPFGTPRYSNGFDTRRARGAAWAAWTPGPGARIEARYGVDRAEREGLYLIPAPFASVDSATSTQDLRDASLSGWLRLQPLPSLAWRAGAGVERSGERMHRRESFHSSLGGFAASTTSLQRRAVGLWLSQGLGWRGTLQVDGMARRDAYREGGPLWSGSAAVAWTVSREPFFPRAGWLDALRLRASWGLIDAKPFAEPDQPIGESFFTLACPGTTPCDRSVRAERNTEIEAGAEGRLWGHLALGVTGYRRETAHLVNESNTLYGVLAQNLGTVRNSGVEGTLRLEGLATGPARWELELLGASNRNRVTRVDFAAANDAQRIVEGYPLGGYWGFPVVSVNDANGDGVLRSCSGPPCEVVLDSLSFLGAAQPGHMLAAMARVHLGGAVTLGARLEHQGGYRLYDRIGALRCTGLPVCRAAFDPSTPLAEQARVIAMLQHSPAGFINDASFTRLREVSVSWSAPEAWLRGLGAGLDLSLSGRDLATWSSYPGLDPEVNSAGPGAYPAYDLGALPLPRTWTARVDVRL